MKLTLIIYGAFERYISCPELRLETVASSPEVNQEDLKRFYRMLEEKAKGITKRQSIPDLVPYARLFMKHRKKIKSNLLRGKEVLIEET